MVATAPGLSSGSRSFAASELAEWARDHGDQGPTVGAWGGVLERPNLGLGPGLDGALGVSSVRTYRTDL
jgi:hypothetical protein